jgi:hypothetical protein
MSAREITVKQLHLTLPRTQGSGGKRDGEAFARSVAGSLAGALNQSGAFHKGPFAGNRSMKELRVQVPRDQAHAEGIAQAIRKAISSNGEER